MNIEYIKKQIQKYVTLKKYIYWLLGFAMLCILLNQLFASIVLILFSMLLLIVLEGYKENANL